MQKSNIKGLAIFIGTLIYFSACQVPTDPLNDFSSAPNQIENISHGFVEGVTPTNADNDSTEWSYPVVQADWDGPGGDKRWLGRNIGSTKEPDSLYDNSAESAGWYFQFNHTQGIYPDVPNDEKVAQHTPGPSSGAQDPDLDSDWIDDDPCNLLLGEKWRIPTQAEWQAVADANAASKLNLHLGGYILANISFLSELGFEGFYWSSTQGAGANTGQAAGLNSNLSLTTENNFLSMWSGIPLRCIED